MFRFLAVVFAAAAAALPAGRYYLINKNGGIRHGRVLAYRKHEYLELRKSNPMVDWSLEPYDGDVFVLRNVYKDTYYQNYQLFDKYINYRGRDLVLTATSPAEAAKFVAVPTDKDGLYYIRDAEKRGWLSNHLRKVHLSRWKKVKWNIVDATHYIPTDSMVDESSN